MPKTRQIKEQTVERLKEKFGLSKSVVFADYKGLTMRQLSDLRDKLQDYQAEFTITKNSILERAINSSQLQILDSQVLIGPTATLFAYDDEITPIKMLVKSLKDAGLGNIKAGFMNGNFLDLQKVIELSTLPTKEQLRGKVVGVLVAPLHGIVTCLQANLRNLVYTVDQIRIQRGGV